MSIRKFLRGITISRKSKHLADINETYTEHARHALWIWWKCVVVVVALPIHALIPDVLVKTATRRLDAVNVYRKKREGKYEKVEPGGCAPSCYASTKPPNCS